MKKVLIIIFAGAFIFIAPAYGDVAIQQNFDDIAAFPPDSNGWYGNSATTNGRWGDFVYPGGPYITNTDSNSPPQSLKVVRGAGQPIGYVTSGVDTDVFEVSYAVKPVTNGSSSCIIFATEGTSTDFSLALYIRDNGNLQYYNGNWTDTGAAVTMGQWSTIRQVATVSTNTWDLYVNGGFIGTFTGVDPVGYVARMHFYPQGSAGNVTLFDDIKVTKSASPPLIAEIFKDNFEDVNAVIWPDPSTDADPVAQVGIWSQIKEERAGVPDSIVDIQVTNAAVPGATQGSNCLVLDRVGYAWVRGNFAVPGGPAPLVIEFDMYVKSDTDAWVAPRVWLRNSTNTDFITNTISADVWWANGELVHYYNDIYTKEVIGTYSTDQWIHVKYQFDFDNKTYDLTVDNTTYTNLTYVEDSNQIRQIVFQGARSGVNWYLDNISVKTTEPTCVQRPRPDFNGDCKVDFADLMYFVSGWLECNLQPAELCSQ